MSGGELVEFLWTEGVMPQKLSAPEYTDEVQQFVKEKLDSIRSMIDDNTEESCAEVTADIRKTYMVIYICIFGNFIMHVDHYEADFPRVLSYIL